MRRSGRLGAALLSGSLKGVKAAVVALQGDAFFAGLQDEAVGEHGPGKEEMNASPAQFHCNPHVANIGEQEALPARIETAVRENTATQIDAVMIRCKSERLVQLR